mgnify:CR=1 FL=1
MARIIVYVFLAFLSFYCLKSRLPVGLKYAVNLLVFGWAFLSFVIQPDFDKAAFCVRFFCLFVFIYVLIWSWSLASPSYSSRFTVLISEKSISPLL